MLDDLPLPPPELFSLEGLSGALLTPLTGRRVKCVITVNGKPVAGVFWEKLISVTVNDREGVKSDTINLVLEDAPPHIAIPQHDDEVQCWLGYEDGPFGFRGTYKVNDVDLDCLPWKIKIKGKSADQTAKLKEHRTRHWDNQTLGGIIGQIASENGLTAQVAPSIASFKYDYLPQQNESAQHLLRRLEQTHNGLFAVKDGKLLFAERGKGETPSGTALPLLTLVPTMILRNSCSVTFGAREKHNKVNAEYHDVKSGRRRRVSARGDSEAEATYTGRHSHGSKNEARAGARSRAKYLKRGGTRTAVTIEGNPDVVAGGPMTYAGVRPGVDGLVFIIEEASHSYTKTGGYRTAIKGKLKDSDTGQTGPGGGGTGGSGTGGAGGSDAIGDEVTDDPTDGGED